jgi:hypothetical protein
MFYDLFVNFLFPPFILTVGLVGNTLGFVVLLNKNLKSIGPRDAYLYLFFCDNFYLLQIIGTFLQYSLSLNFPSISNISCKLWNYFNYSIAPISAWLIIYISLDRYTSIKFPAWRFTLRKESTQLALFLIIIVINFAFYLPVPLFYDLKDYNNTSTCNFIDTFALELISYMDLSIRVVVPFVLMISLTILLTYELFKSRRRIVENFLAEENQTFYKEIRLAFTSICFNLIYILTQLPISLTIFYSDYFSNLFYIFTYYIFYLSYAINFYIILVTNSLFRTKFIEIFIRSN